MPNVITHGLMAQDVIQLLDDNVISKAVAQYPRLFFLGSNGPDFLFYYRFLSHDADAKSIRQIGSIFHNEHVNDWYEVALKTVSLMHNEKQKMMAVSYIAGHLCHWALDSIAHPYVFHKTGLIQDETRYDHFRFEAMLDLYVVNKIKNLDIKDVPSYKFVSLNKDERVVVAKIYQQCCIKILKRRVSLEKFDKAMRSMEKFNKLLFDPKSHKTKVVKLIEKHVLKDPWIYSSHFVVGDLDQQHDILNLSHSPWSHPCDNTLIYTTSFIDMYRESCSRANEALQRMNQDIENKTFTLGDYLDNRNYETGFSYPSEMNNFSLVYNHQD